MMAASMRALRQPGLLILLNAALAFSIQAAAPRPPRHSDRQEYEWVGRHGLASNCPWSIYCYRLLVPMVLERIPADPERRWRGYQIATTTLAGSIASLTTAAP